MEDLLIQTWDELMGRDSGPFKLRLILQPSVAVFLAIRAGWNDSKEGKHAFLWVWDSDERERLLRHVWKDIGKLFLVGILLDVVYQLIVLHAVHPLQALMVATVLAVIPYMAVRGPTNLIVTHFRGVGPNS